MKNNAVFCITKDQNQAHQIATDLENAGFRPADISILLADKKGNTHTEGMDTPRASRNQPHGGVGHEKHTKAPEGATIGAATGGVIGGAVGLLAGLGAIAIPGVGPFLAAGPLLAALSGSAIGGGAGMVVGALAGLGIPEYEAKRYSERLKNGGILISVHTGNAAEVTKAKRVFEAGHAEDIAMTAEATAPASSSKKKH